MLTAAEVIKGKDNPEFYIKIMTRISDLTYEDTTIYFMELLNELLNDFDIAPNFVVTGEGEVFYKKILSKSKDDSEVEEMNQRNDSQPF